MTTQNPRINVVLDDTLYKSVRFLAQKDHVSLSSKIRDLVKDALEVHEDIVLSAIAQHREETLDEVALLTHEETWD